MAGEERNMFGKPKVLKERDARRAKRAERLAAKAKKASERVKETTAAIARASNGDDKDPRVVKIEAERAALYASNARHRKQLQENAARMVELSTEMKAIRDGSSSED